MLIAYCKRRCQFPRMKSILVPTGGSEADKPVFETALAVARLFSSHLRFVHFRVSLGQAAAYTPGVEFASGPGLRDALEQLQTDADDRAGAAAREVRELCRDAKIELADAPGPTAAVTASWREEAGDARHRLIFLSRHSDLVVMGRATRPNALPPDLLPTLLMGCGRPVLLAAATAPSRLDGTIMVAWRDTPDAARAMVAAAPLLGKAARVVFVAVDEGIEGTRDAIDDVARQFRWTGVPADVEVVAPDGRPVSDVLLAVAKARGADLMVMGAYGHSPMRELIFGGATQAAIQHADIPILLLH
jgi:nucleotide-binding universal stress UspA family protein